MVNLELKPSEYIMRNFTFTTSGMCDPDVFGYTLNKIGAERLMFAVDYPYEDTKVAADFLDTLDLTEEQRAGQPRQCRTDPPRPGRGSGSRGLKTPRPPPACAFTPGPAAVSG
jgi:hypothetical protein